MHVCIYVCTYVYMYIFMYVCMYVGREEGRRRSRRKEAWLESCGPDLSLYIHGSLFTSSSYIEQRGQLALKGE